MDPDPTLARIAARQSPRGTATRCRGRNNKPTTIISTMTPKAIVTGDFEQRRTTVVEPRNNPDGTNVVSTTANNIQRRAKMEEDIWPKECGAASGLEGTKWNIVATELLLLAGQEIPITWHSTCSMRKIVLSITKDHNQEKRTQYHVWIVDMERENEFHQRDLQKDIQSRKDIHTKSYDALRCTVVCGRERRSESNKYLATRQISYDIGEFLAHKSRTGTP